MGVIEKVNKLTDWVNAIAWTDRQIYWQQLVHSNISKFTISFFILELLDPIYKGIIQFSNCYTS